MRTPLRSRVRKRHIIPKKPISEASGYEEIRQAIRSLQGLKVDLERQIDGVLERAEKRVDSFLQEKDQGIHTEKRELFGSFKKELSSFMSDMQDHMQSVLSSIEKQATQKLSKITQPKDGEDADEERIVKRLTKIFKPRHGKDADEKRIERKVLKQLPVKELEKALALVESLEKRTFSIDDIKGLRETLRALSSKTMLGNKSPGGGMGTIKFFKFTCDGSTTEFELPDIPTQDGAAVFAYYQSGRLHNDEHFTVSGETMTTTFTGVDQEIIDGWIIT